VLVQIGETLTPLVVGTFYNSFTVMCASIFMTYQTLARLIFGCSPAPALRTASPLLSPYIHKPPSDQAVSLFASLTVTLGQEPMLKVPSGRTPPVLRTCGFGISSLLRSLKRTQAYCRWAQPEYLDWVFLLTGEPVTSLDPGSPIYIVIPTTSAKWLRSWVPQLASC
jgi:hypothetical protein